MEEFIPEDCDPEPFDFPDKKIRRRAFVIGNLDREKELKIVEQTLLPHLENLSYVLNNILSYFWITLYALS